MKRWSTGWVCLVAAALMVSGVAVSGAAAAVTVAKPLYVSASAASDPACGSASRANPFHTIAAALACAQAGATIHIGVGQFAGEVSIAVDVTLTGAGAGTVIADPSAAVDLVPEITITPGHTVILSKLHINGADNAANPAHAGIRMGAGNLTLQQVAINATIASNGAGIDAEPSSGDTTITVQNSTISNAVALQGGGAILLDPLTGNGSAVNLLNSTLSGNRANVAGGGVYLTYTSLTSLESSIVDNSSGRYGGGIYVQPVPDHTATLTDTILAANTTSGAGPDCYADVGATTTLISGGGNLIGQDTGANGTGCAGFTNNTDGDQVGTGTSPIDPVLGPLADNGGPTPTRAPLPGSPAIGTGNPTDCQAAPIDNLDQRGKSRHADTRDSCDIGAYDTGGRPVQSLYVRHAAASDPACGAASRTNPFHTIAAALACAQDGATIHIGAGEFAGEVTAAANVTLTGAGAATVISDPGGSADLVPEITIADGRTVTVRDLHIDGADTSGNPLHAGIRMGAGNLTLQQVAINATIASNGAGIDAEPSSGDTTITVQNSTISNAVALDGGGAILLDPTPPVYPDKTRASALNLLNSTISGNRANIDGGGVYLTDASLTSRESSIVDNSAGYGGGLYLPAPTPGNTATLTGTILAANTVSHTNSAPDCYAGAGATTPLNSGGGNLIGQDTGANGTGCAGFTNNTDGDQVGTGTSPIDPVLGPLADNGGPTPTQALLSGSPAIGTGNVTDCQASPITNLDQRGEPRHADTRDSCDIGAYDTGGSAT